MSFKLKPRFHGNGFIQIYLNPLTRLHIWTPRLKATRVQNARIHDHRFMFTSQVLLGSLVHTEYDVTQTADGDHGLWQQGPEFSGKDSPLEFVGNCDVERRTDIYYGPGDAYDFGGPDKFHDTEPFDPLITTVTVLTKTYVIPDTRARIVAMNKERPDHAFEKQPDLALLRAEVLKVLPRLF